MQPLPPGYILFPSKQQHVLGPPVIIPPHLSISGHEQSERICKTCGTTRVTIIGVPEDEARAWRPPGETAQGCWGMECRAVGK